MKPCFFVTFDIIISHISEHMKLFFSISNIFVIFFRFLTFPCYKKTNNMNM